MSDYFERIEGHLLDAVERHANTSPRRSHARRPAGHPRHRASFGLAWPRRLPSLSNIAVVLASASALVVAAGALILIGHRPTTPGAAGQVPAGARPLVAELGVLRRPQTNADEATIEHPRWVTILPSLTRLATTLPNGEMIFFYIGKVDLQKAPPRLRELLRQQQRRRGSSYLGYSLGYYLAGAHGGAGPAPGYSASVIRQIRGPWWSQQDGHDARFTAIVPDGVARVRWVFAGHGYPLLNVSIDVKGNIASANVARALNDFPTQTTWYAPDGRPIQTTRGTSAP